MEGLTAFVSRFDKGKPENRRTQNESKAERGQDKTPSAPSNLVSLPFSIAEILSDKRNASRSNETEDIPNDVKSYTVQGKMVNLKKEGNYSLICFRMYITSRFGCYLSSLIHLRSDMLLRLQNCWKMV